VFIILENYQFNFNNMNQFSQTQLSNLAVLAGIIMMILPKLGIGASMEQVTFFLGVAWNIGWTIYSYYDRFKKGDLSLGGRRIN
jgi:hypothetical protein